MNSRLLAAAIAVALPLPLLAQTQQVRPPIAHYWMSVETAGGMGMEMPPGMGGMMPPGMQGGKRMKLELGSSRQAAGDHARRMPFRPGSRWDRASAAHTAPRRARAGTRSRNEEPEFERPKGRMLTLLGLRRDGAPRPSR